MPYLLPLCDLLPDQLRMVEAPPTEHRVIFGPPGSGKTQVLVHRAAYLSQEYSVPPDRLHIFVFTNVLKEFIRSSLDMLDLPDDSVSTFAEWCADIYRKHKGGRLPWDAVAKKPDFAAIRQEVARLANTEPALRGSLDFALIDEGQDLTAEEFGILARIARHVTVFADHQQQIFEDGASEEEILRALGLHRRNANLLAGYRNSPDVAALAACFIPNENARRIYLAQVKNHSAVRERPLCYLASSFDDEIDRLATVLHQRQVMNQNVGIIVPQVRHVHGLAKGLADRGITVEMAVGANRGRGTEAVHFDNLAPKIATYQSAKGLTFDCVLLPRLCEALFPRVTGEARHRLLFVGITRATQWVYLSTVSGSAISEVNLLAEAETEGRLVIQRSESGQQPLNFDETDDNNRQAARDSAHNYPADDQDDDDLSIL